MPYPMIYVTEQELREKGQEAQKKAAVQRRNTQGEEDQKNDKSGKKSG